MRSSNDPTISRKRRLPTTPFSSTSMTSSSLPSHHTDGRRPVMVFLLLYFAGVSAPAVITSVSSFSPHYMRLSQHQWSKKFRRPEVRPIFELSSRNSSSTSEIFDDNDVRTIETTADTEKLALHNSNDGNNEGLTKADTMIEGRGEDAEEEEDDYYRDWQDDFDPSDVDRNDDDNKSIDADDDTNEDGGSNNDEEIIFEDDFNPSSSVSNSSDSSTPVARDDRWIESSVQTLLSEGSVGTWTGEDFDLFKETINCIYQRQSLSYRAKGHARCAIHQEYLIRRLIEEQEAGNPLAFEFDMSAMYGPLIKSWYKSGKRFSAARCESILDELQDRYNSDPVQYEHFKPNSKTWNRVMLAYARSDTRDAPSHVVRIISKLEDLYNDGKTDCYPDLQSYKSILIAHRYVGGADAPDKVLEILNRMTELADQGHSSIRPDAGCHNIYLQSLSASSALYSANIPNIVRKAEIHFEKMKQCPEPSGQPDMWTYNALLVLLSKGGDRDHTFRAEELINEIEQKGWIPACNTFNCFISCYILSKRRGNSMRVHQVLEKMKRLGQHHPGSMPDKVTYNAVLNVYAKSRDKNATYMADELIEEMAERYEATGNPTFKATTMTLNTLCDVYAKSNRPDAASRIWKQIELMEELSEQGDKTVAPNQFTYNMYLKSISSLRTPWSADEAMRILRLIQEKSTQPGREGLWPDVFTYTAVLHAIALSGIDDSFQKAYVILQEMEEGDMHMRPNVYTYNVLINVVAKSKMIGKAKIAVQLLRRMKQVSIVPITMTMNNILNACAYSDRSEDRVVILQIALLILKEAQETCGANYITYGTALRTIRCFGPDDYVERWQLIRKVFRQCLNDGQFMPQVLTNVKGKGIKVSDYNLLVEEVSDSSGGWKQEYMAAAKKARHGMKNSKVL